MLDLDKAAGVIAEPFEATEKLALTAIHDTDGRGMVGAGRNHLHQRVARAICADRKRVLQALSDAGLLLPEGFVAVKREAVAACEGEQRHFKTWAMAERYDMDEHPMFYLFMDEKTNAARKGWNAALAYVRAMIQAQETEG